MDLDAEYLLVREQLYQLGFQQPLPIGSLALVKSLLDDLVKTTTHLKRFNDDNKKLLKEKIAWDLSVEPYKCDNSRLLAECNRLHLELLKQREEDRLKVCEARRKARNLETDNRCLEEQCEELSGQLRTMFAAVNGSKRKDDKKPFVSTVRTNALTPSEAKMGRTAGGMGRFMKSSCTCGKEPLKGLQTQRLKDDVQSQGDFIVELRSQIDSRDREIVRLNSLLTGGRPTAALGKDCCYRGVGTLSQDVVLLQKQKVSLQADLTEAVAQQHEAKERAIALAALNHDLEQKLHTLEEAALAIEATANKKVRAIEAELRLSKLEKPHETKLSKTKATRDMENGSIQNKTTINRYKEQIEKLQTELDRVLKHDFEMTELNEKLCSKHSRLKIRYKTLLNEKLESIPDKRDAAISPLSPAVGASNISLIRSERDYYQKEYLRLMNQPENTIEVENLREQLRTRNEQLLEFQRAASNSNSNASAPPETSRSVQSMLNRVEREKTAMQYELERIRNEAEMLHDRWMESKEELRVERDRSAAQQLELKLQLNRLEGECNVLAAQQGTEFALQSRLNSLEAINRQQSDELVRLQTSNQQLKTLHGQTEVALVHQQSMLHQTENKLGSTTSRLSMVDSSRQESQHRIDELRTEVASLRSLNVAAESEKDQLTSELDTKTEKLHHAEADLAQSRSTIREQQSRIDVLQRQFDATSSDVQRKEGTLRQSSNETESLRRQVTQLVRNNENAMAENRRLESELADQKNDHESTRTRLVACEKEVERLKRQLQKYVQEVQKAEELLMNKEAERDEMLDQFKSLSKDAIQLEDNNQSLEQQACDARRGLHDAESKIAHLADQLRVREVECERLDRQVTELSRQVAVTGSDMEHCVLVQQTLQADLDATKDLCDRLDDEKRKVNAELDECSDIRRKLERDNEKLRSEMRNAKSGDRSSSAEGIQQLLTVARLDLDQKRNELDRKNQEMGRLRDNLDDLRTKYADGRIEAARHEALAKEYSVQIQELQQKLTDKRFEKLTRREHQQPQPSPPPDHDRHPVNVGSGGQLPKNTHGKGKMTRDSLKPTSYEHRKGHLSLDQKTSLQQDLRRSSSMHHSKSKSDGVEPNLSTESTSNSSSDTHSDRYSISESDSTETSQLNRISRHLMGNSRRSFTQSQTPVNKSSSAAMYFQPNASESEETALIQRLNIVPSTGLNLNKISNVVDVARAEDGPTLTAVSHGEEVIELARLHERFIRQHSSEEEILTSKTIPDESSNQNHSDSSNRNNDDIRSLPLFKSFSDPHYRSSPISLTYLKLNTEIEIAIPSHDNIEDEEEIELKNLEYPALDAVPDQSSITYRKSDSNRSTEQPFKSIHLEIPPMTESSASTPKDTTKNIPLKPDPSNTSIEVFHSAVWQPPQASTSPQQEPNGDTQIETSAVIGPRHRYRDIKPITIDTSHLPPPPPIRCGAVPAPRTHYRDTSVKLRVYARQEATLHSEVAAAVFAVGISE